VPAHSVHAHSGSIQDYKKVLRQHVKEEESRFKQSQKAAAAAAKAK
jgi:hypothetical protein